MRRLLLICFVVFPFFLSFAGPVNLTVTTDKSTCHVGDPVTISARAIVREKTPVSFRLIKPEPEQNSESGDTDALPPVWGTGKTSDEKLPDGYHLYRYTVTVRPFRLGVMPLGKIQVVSNGKTIERKVPDIEVISMFSGGKEKKTINPLKPQLEIRPDYSRLIRVVLIGLAGLLGCILLIFVILKLLRRFRDKAGDSSETRIPSLPPCDEVRQMLGALLASRLLKDGEIKAFYVRLAEIGKRFLGRAFGLDYSVETSGEMLENLAGHTTREEDRMVRDFLEACDMVKFAKLVPTQGEINSHVNLVYKLADMICRRQHAESGEREA